MRKTISLSLAGGLALCVLSFGLFGNAAFGEPKAPEAPASDPVPPPTPRLDPLADRRASLNARLSGMIRAGEGSRLTDAVAPRPGPRAQSWQPTGSTPQRRAETASQSVARTEISTIAPPPSVSAAPRSRGGGYRAPSLDLRSPPRVPNNDIECLTQAIYYEARNESEEGQAAVAEVVINRSRTQGYPSKICEVVYQRNTRTCQFTFTCDGSIGRGAVNMTAWGRAERIAREVYAGGSQRRLPDNSVNYHANYVRPSWGRRLERVRQIGAHIFYGAALAGGRTPGSQEPQREPERPLLFHRIPALDQAYAAVTSSTASRAPEGGGAS